MSKRIERYLERLVDLIQPEEWAGLRDGVLHDVDEMEDLDAANKNIRDEVLRLLKECAKAIPPSR